MRSRARSVLAGIRLALIGSALAPCIHAAEENRPEATSADQEARAVLRGNLEACNQLIRLSRKRLDSTEQGRMLARRQLELKIDLRRICQSDLDRATTSPGATKREIQDKRDAVAVAEAVERAERLNFKAIETEILVVDAQLGERRAEAHVFSVELKALDEPGDPAQRAVFEAQAMEAEAHFKTNLAEVDFAEAELEAAEASVVAARKKVAVARAKSERAAVEAAKTRDVIREGKAG